MERLHLSESQTAIVKRLAADASLRVLDGRSGVYLVCIEPEFAVVDRLSGNSTRGLQGRGILVVSGVGDPASNVPGLLYTLSSAARLEIANR